MAAAIKYPEVFFPGIADVVRAISRNDIPEEVLSQLPYANKAIKLKSGWMLWPLTKAQQTILLKHGLATSDKDDNVIIKPEFIVLAMARQVYCNVSKNDGKPKILVGFVSRYNFGQLERKRGDDVKQKRIPHGLPTTQAALMHLVRRIKAWYVRQWSTTHITHSYRIIV